MKMIEISLEEYLLLKYQIKDWQRHASATRLRLADEYYLRYKTPFFKEGCDMAEVMLKNAEKEFTDAFEALKEEKLTNGFMESKNDDKPMGSNNDQS